MRQIQLLIIVITIYISDANANIIRDSEIEESIELIIAPLRKASGLKELKIYIIDDPIPNAFTAGGNNIFINSGLIIKNPDPDILRGVIAHEIGHILGKHVIRRQEVVDNYQKAAFGATALGLAAAISSGSTEGLVVATMGGTHIAERSIYAYSRNFESSADQAALKILEKSSHSSIGLINFFKKMQMFSKNSMVNPYDRTHPSSNDRLRILRSSNEKSRFKNSQNNDDIIYKYARSSAKLAAFTLDLDKTPSCSYEQNADEVTHYMKAIKCFRIGDFDNSLNHINHLIMEHPNDPYYHEFKAQLYFESGRKEALGEYIIASKEKPNDVLIRLGKAIVGIKTNINNPRNLNKFYKDLQFILQKEPENLLARYYLAIYYEKKGLTGKSHLNTAIISLHSGRNDDARKMAISAIKLLPKNSPDWYQASDILAATKR